MSPSEYEILISTIAREFTNNPLDNNKWEMNFGRTNRLEGFSKYRHQIDVSLESEKDVILIECKKWTRRITVAEYLVLLGRVQDISKNKTTKRVRGALITTSGWQKGVVTVNSAYNDYCSLFQVNEVGEIRERIHTVFMVGSATIRFTAQGKLTSQ